MYFTIEDFDLKNKTIGLRIDLNSPIINGKIILNERFYRHSKTIKYLLSKGSKIVLITHQGRPGKKDYLSSLEQHTKLLSKILGLDIKYLDNLLSNESFEYLKNMDEGELILLENIRNYDFEMDKDKIYSNPFIRIYSHIFDYYLIDSFSVAHREHSSIVGFKNKIPMGSGLVFDEEFLHVLSLKEAFKRPIIYILGGEKIDDLIDLIVYSIENNKVDRILTTGFLSILALEAAGIKTNDERVDSYKDIIKKIEPYISKLELPNDLAIDFYGRRREINVFKLENYRNIKAYDIGSNTIREYKKLIKKAKTIYIKGPAGLFEDPKFAKGSYELIKSIKENEDAFKFLGGGHVVSAAEEFFNKEEFKNTYFSISGGAVVKFLANKKLPALEALKENYKKFKNVLLKQ